MELQDQKLDVKSVETKQSIFTLNDAIVAMKENGIAGITNKILNCDCLEIMKGMPDKSVDLVLTDPPYNVGINYDTHKDNMTREEFIEWARSWFTECRRISQTVLITGQARLPDYAIIEPWKWLLAWWKPAAMGRSPVGFCNFEPIAMWGKGSNAGVDVIKARIIPNKEVEGHPCPKPIDWAIGQISLFPKAKIILDPFAGSGTTLIAASNNNRIGIGLEIDKHYCEVAKQRIINETGTIDFANEKNNNSSGTHNGVLQKNKIK